MLSSALIILRWRHGVMAWVWGELFGGGMGLEVGECLGREGRGLFRGSVTVGGGDHGW